MTNTTPHRSALRRRHSVLLGAVVTVGIGLGSAGVASAAAPEPSSGNRGALTCENVPTITARLDQAETRLNDLLQRLRGKRAEAVEAGRERVVAKLDKMIARAEAALAKLEERAARLDAWAAENC